MKQPDSGSRPHIAPGDISRQFWQVADADSFKGYFTPFEKIRRDRGHTLESMAQAMKMRTNDYMDMEEGAVVAEPADIAEFCRILRCSPLDLFKPAPGYDGPMPRDIFGGSLTLIRETRRVHSRLITDLGARLHAEYQRADAVINAHTETLKPLLHAMGYSHDLKQFVAACYTPAPECDPSNRENEVEAFVGGDPDDKRVYMDNCLNRHQIMLETECDDRREILARVSKKAEASLRILFNMSAAIFGAEKSVEAADTVVFALERLPDINEFCTKFTQDPSVIGITIHPEAPHDIAPKAGLLVNVAKTYAGLKSVLEEGSVFRNVDHAEKRLYDFLNWRDDPKTQTLFHWVENWLDLNEIERKSSSIDPDSRPRGPLPIAPK